MRMVLAWMMLLVVVQGKSVSTDLGSFVQTTVYSGSKAEVERLIHVSEELPLNEYHTVTVHGLSPQVQDATIRVKTSTDSSASILDVKIDTIRVPRRFLPQYKLEEESLMRAQREYQDSMKRMNSELSRLSAQMKSVHAYVNNSIHSEDSKTRLTISEVSKLLAFRAEEQERYDAAVLELESKISKLSAVDMQLHILRDHNADYHVDDVFLPVYKVDKVLTFRVLVSESVPLDFTISYMITTASWSPEYDIHINNKRSSNNCNSSADAVCDATTRGKLYSMSIEYFANVAQSTGEHWVDTSLVLSTADPVQHKKHPEAKIAGVQLQKPPAPQTWAPSPPPTELPRWSPSAEPTAAPTASPSWSPTAVPTVAPTARHEVQMVKAQGISAGDIGASRKFKIPYPVSVNSSNLFSASMPKGSEVSR